MLAGFVYVFLIHIGCLPIRGGMNCPYLPFQIDPELLQKFRKVKDMKDFVKLFKPKGFTIKEEVIHRKPSGIVFHNFLISREAGVLTEK